MNLPTNITTAIVTLQAVSSEIARLQKIESELKAQLRNYAGEIYEARGGDDDSQHVILSGAGLATVKVTFPRPVPKLTAPVAAEESRRLLSTVAWNASFQYNIRLSSTFGQAWNEADVFTSYDREIIKTLVSWEPVTPRIEVLRR